MLFESLETRAHFSSTDVWSPTITEAEPNTNPRQANFVQLGYDGITRVSGLLRTGNDRDTFKFRAWQGGVIKLSVNQRGPEAVGLNVYNSSGNLLISTSTVTRLNIKEGRTYYLQFKNFGTGIGRYSLLIRQAGLETSAERLYVLGKGVNVASWFWNIYDSSDPYNAFYNYFGSYDAKLLHDAGFRHIRLPVDSKYFVDWSNPSKLNASALAALDDAISLLLRYNIGVIVSPFGDYNDRVVWPDSHQGVIDFMRAWAGHLSKYDPNRVFLQTGNEPSGDPSLWLPVQKEIVAAMRQAAPHHTIITSTTLRYGPVHNAFGTIEALTTSTPLPDPNIVYGFHYYEPYIFTAQGAEWAWPGYGSLRYVPYPSSPENVQYLSDQLNTEITDPNRRFVIDSLLQYGKSRWDSSTIRGRIQLVKDWATYWGVKVINDEFGAIADTQISSTDRDHWIGDVRSIDESFGFGWTMWDYSAGYNLADGGWYSRQLRPDVLTALGLR